MAPGTLECLPNEILERIHLEALEVNFPRCSARVAAAVSREIIYRIFVIQAYWNDPQQCIRNRHFHRESILRDTTPNMMDYMDLDFFTAIFRPTFYRPLPPKEQARLQSKVVTCRWFTVSRFRKILETFPGLTLNALSRQFLFQPACLHFNTSHAQVGNGLRAAFLDNTDLCMIYDPFAKYFAVQDSFIIKASYQSTHQGASHIIRTVRVLSIPDALLEGPWTEESIEIVILLRRAIGKRFLSGDSGEWASLQRKRGPTFSGEACLNGITRAINERRERLFRYLLDLQQAYNSPPTHFSYEPQIPHKPFLLAMAAYPQARIFLHLLVQTSPSYALSHQSILRWARNSSQPRDLLKDWLVEYFRVCQPSLTQRVFHKAKRLVYPGVFRTDQLSIGDLDSVSKWRFLSLCPPPSIPLLGDEWWI
ncbi:hypothetical protein NUU61_001612 [Penicillium alfredii]|uniref:Uncharacterized protein n=1 Tax=Penicillium alfredii TaxID=1506179 RepID=A0A9W9KL63_9EURO|nr:uncharacterized protein NUU61_001612 [Penicillium alfredii]KAJ5110355.1 hypothetical protein NUU61_001612 [Penicillium alfredii]